MTHQRVHFDPTEKFTPLGLAIWRTGCVRLFRDGDGIGEVYRWWHPVAWLTWVGSLIWCGFIGEKVNEVVRFRLSDYWREHRDEIEWL